MDSGDALRRAPTRTDRGSVLSVHVVVEWARPGAAAVVAVAIAGLHDGAAAAVLVVVVVVAVETAVVAVAV